MSNLDFQKMLKAANEEVSRGRQISGDVSSPLREKAEELFPGIAGLFQELNTGSQGKMRFAFYYGLDDKGRLDDERVQVQTNIPSSLSRPQTVVLDITHSSCQIVSAVQQEGILGGGNDALNRAGEILLRYAIETGLIEGAKIPAQGTTVKQDQTLKS